MAKRIVAIPVQYSNPDTVFDVADNSTLSFRAIGLFAWLHICDAFQAGLPVDILTSELDGADEVDEALRQLAEAGYVTIEEEPPSYRRMTLEKAFAVIGDMSGGQLYNFDPETFVANPEPALVLLAAARLVAQQNTQNRGRFDDELTYVCGSIFERKQLLCRYVPAAEDYIERAFAGMSLPLLSVPRQYRDYQYEQRGESARKPRAGYVYVLRSSTGAFKIGYASSPDDRLRTFSVKLPFEVEYEVLIKTDDMLGYEAQLHERFADKRINGEWFALTDDDLAELRAMDGAL